MSTQIIRIAIFASGAGSNALKIIEHFQQSTTICVALVACNNPQAGVLTIARQYNIDTLLIEKDRFFKGDGYAAELENRQINFIVLAGFLWKVPKSLIKLFPKKIINIHPALLPKYGGKGMYGTHVHEAVLQSGEKESGITIHYVDEQYDHSAIIFQARCSVQPTDTPDDLAQKIHALEHYYFAPQIEKIILSTN